jgi:integrase/recombinase XerD
MKRYKRHRPKPFLSRLGKYVEGSFKLNFDTLAVGTATPAMIETWILDLKKERNLATTTLPNIRCAANQFFQFVVLSGGLTINPVAKVKVKIDRDEIPKRRRVILSEAEINKLNGLLSIHSPTRVAPIVKFLSETGARLGEALNLRWEQVNFENGTVQFLRTKNTRDRLIQVTPEVLELLRSLRNESSHVFLNMHGTPWAKGQYEKQYSTVKKKFALGVYWNNHNLRHSFAANYLKSGGDIVQLQYHLGHQDLAMTVGLYGRIEAEELPALDLYGSENYEAA